MPKKKSKQQTNKDIVAAYTELLGYIDDFVKEVKRLKKAKDYKGLVDLSLDAEEVGVYLGNLYYHLRRKIDTAHYYTTKETPYIDR